MSDSTWDDYLSTDLSDPSTAVPAYADAVEDLAATADAGDLVSDLDQVDLDTAAYQADLAVGQQSWADWTEASGDQATADAADWIAYGDEQAAAGNTEIAEDAYASASDQLSYASDSYADSADYSSSTAGYLDSSADSLASVDTSYDTTSYDSTSYDSTSYDTGLDTGSEY